MNIVPVGCGFANLPTNRRPRGHAERLMAGFLECLFSARMCGANHKSDNHPSEYYGQLPT
jgi:hypothetical protein